MLDIGLLLVKIRIMRFCSESRHSVRVVSYYSITLHIAMWSVRYEMRKFRCVSNGSLRPLVVDPFYSVSFVGSWRVEFFFSFSFPFLSKSCCCGGSRDDDDDEEEEEGEEKEEGMGSLTRMMMMERERQVVRSVVVH